MATTTVLAFYEPGAPNPVTPTLKVEIIEPKIEISPNISPSTRVFPQAQEVPLGHRERGPSSSKYELTDLNKPFLRSPPPSPPEDGPEPETPDPTTNLDDRDSTPSSELESPETRKSDHEAARVLIPKPPGEAGRRGYRGYNIKRELGWEVQRFHRLKVGP